MKSLDQLSHEAEIRQLLERYTTAVNLRDWDAYRACWSKTAVWELQEPLNVRKSGIEEIMTEVITTVESLELFVQMTHSIMITDLTDKSAKAIVTLNEIGRPFKDSKFPFPGLYILAKYFDDLVRENGAWVFAKRTYKVAYWDASPLKADVYQQKWVMPRTQGQLA